MSRSRIFQAYAGFWVMLCIALLALQVQAQERDSFKRAATSGKRIAMVIGNDAYQRVRPLQKAGNDATAMARELKAAGFEVLLHKDLNYRGMVRAVETLSNSITGGDQVVVFFAGHGVQIKSGSYLLPVDIEATSESEIEKTSYGLSDLTDKLTEAKASFALILVDACRDNPLKSNGRSVGSTRGLSPIDPPKGQMVVYSASKGQQALDSLSDTDRNPNGVFTREFIKRMRQPGVRVEDLVREVQDSVEALARTVSHEQRPALYSEARGNFYFFGPTRVSMQAGNMVADPESEAWAAAGRANSHLGYDIYLNAYPEGRYVVAARIALGSFKQFLPQVVTAEKSTQTAWDREMAADAEWSAADQWRQVIASATSGAAVQAYLDRHPGKLDALKASANKGDSEAQAQLARLYLGGWGGVAQDLAEGVALLRKASDQGNALGQSNLGLLHVFGFGVPKDDAEAVKWARKAAAQGDAQGQHILGLAYTYGSGVSRDVAEAVKWYRLAAEQGHAEGQNSLGLMYGNGVGVTKDDAEAVKWYRNAAAQGSVQGQTNLGVMYVAGLGVTKDEAEAARWYRRAADQGYAQAQTNLGVMYATGRGIAKDEVEAVKWYRMAAEQGHAEGQNNLGFMYGTGAGAVKDMVEAVKWYRRAAEQGYAMGQTNLGWMYESGTGIAADGAEAVKWYVKAASQGDPNAQANLKRLGRM
jgi:TPR repeat protein